MKMDKLNEMIDEKLRKIDIVDYLINKNLDDELEVIKLKITRNEYVKEFIELYEMKEKVK